MALTKLTSVDKSVAKKLLVPVDAALAVHTADIETNTNSITDNTTAIAVNAAAIVTVAEGQTAGVIVFATYALLDAYTPATAQEKASFKVTDDSNTSLNGYYSWVSGTTYTKDADLVNGVIESGNVDAVSGETVFNHVVDSVNLNSPTNLVEDELLLENSSLAAGGSTTTGFYNQANILTTAIDTTEKILGTPNSCKITLTTSAAVGTIGEHRAYANGYIFQQNKVNVSLSLLFNISTNIQVAVYKYGSVVTPIVAFTTYSVVAGVPLTVNLQGLLPVGQENDITYIATLVRPLGNNATFNNEIYYFTTPYVYGGERVQSNNSAQNIKAKLLTTDYVSNTLDKNNTLNPVSGKSVFDYVAPVNFNSPPSLVEDELLNDAASINPASGNTGFKSNANNLSVVLDDSVTIGGTERNCKYTMVGTTSVATGLEHRTYTDSHVFEGNLVNASLSLLFNFTGEVSLGLYKYGLNGAAQVLQAFDTYQVESGVPLNVNMQGSIPVGQENDIQYIAILGKPTTLGAWDNKIVNVTTPYVYGGERVQSNNSTKNIVAKLGPSVSRRYPYVELFSSAGLEGVVPVGTSILSGFQDLSRATITFTDNLLFAGYSKMISAVVAQSAPSGTKVHYTLKREDALKGDLEITKVIKLMSLFRLEVSTTLKVGLYLISPTGNRWFDGSTAKSYAFTANTDKLITAEGSLTDAEVAAFTSIEIFIRQDGELPSINGETIFMDSWNIYSDIAKGAMVAFPVVTDAFTNPIDTWGDSTTAANGYQDTLATGTGLSVNNYGVASEWTQMIRKRFVAHYTANPNDLENFMVIWMGTNNLLNFNRSGPSSDVDDPLYDRLYARSYQDQFYRDLNIMLDMIPHNNYLIIGGHAGTNVLKTSDNWVAQDNVDSFLRKSQPSNSLSLRESLLEDSDFLDTHVTVNFVKPSVAGSVSITVSDATWINTNGNTGSICIGTKDTYDEYSVNSVSGSVFTCTLVTDGGHFPIGHTMQAVYHLQADLNRGYEDVNLAVFSKEDIFSYENTNVPRSTSSDTVHFTTAGYDRIGDLFAKRVNQVLHKFN